MVEDPRDRKKNEEMKKQLEDTFKRLNDSIDRYINKVKKDGLKKAITWSVSTLFVGAAVGVYIDRKYL